MPQRPQNGWVGPGGGGVTPCWLSGLVHPTAPLAERQHGVLTHGQAVGVGVTRSAIGWRLRTGDWEPLAQGVYRQAGTPRTWRQQLTAFTLAAGPGAAASHLSAAALLQLPGFPPGPLEVTTPRPQRRRGEPGNVHRSRVLPPAHLTQVDGITTTRVARTLVDLAGVLRPARTERAIDNCLAAGLVTLEALRTTTLDLAVKGRAGIALMRRLLEQRVEGLPAGEPPGSALPPSRARRRPAATRPPARRR